MSNETRRAPQDVSKINVNEHYDLAFWTKELSVSEERLMRAVKKVGPSTMAVRYELAK